MFIFHRTVPLMTVRMKYKSNSLVLFLVQRPNTGQVCPADATKQFGGIKGVNIFTFNLLFSCRILSTVWYNAAKPVLKPIVLLQEKIYQNLFKEIT